MQINSLLAQRFREVVLNGTFIANTNFKDQLNGLDYKIATKQISSLNTIAILAQHIHYYINGVNQAFKGLELTIKDKYSFDFEPIISQEQWNTFLSKFWNDAEEFAYLVEQMNDDKLQSDFVNEKYGSYYRNVDAMIEHCYYHLGQIVLIKKLILNGYE